MTGLRACVLGIGVLGPGFDSWASCARVLEGADAYVHVPTVVPPPAALPPAERRRTGTSVRMALAVGFEAVAHAELDPASLPSVFAHSGSDGQNLHDICLTLASSTPGQLSPTRFHNSVHNAPAGYWGIASGATPPANVLCAYDGSFAAGLLEAVTQVLLARSPVLLVASDSEYHEPLRSTRPIPDSFGVAMVLAPERARSRLASLSMQLTDAPPELMTDATLETLRASIPAARSLPLLLRIARREPGAVVLDYLDSQRLAIEVM
jgi:hypothetical protein